MKILLIGAEGRLGQMLGKLFAREDLLPLGHTQLDICDEAAVRRCFEAERPDCVLNTAAFHGIDDCEAHPDRGFAVNAAGAAHVARAAQSAGAVVAHFSTDYVFDGAQRKPYTETDAPAPLSVYAISKLAGEWAVRRYCERHFVVRTSTLFGPPARRHFREDFVGKMLRLAREGGPIRVVCDQWRSPTRATDLATLVAALIPTARYGTYHISNSAVALARGAGRRAARAARPLNPRVSWICGAAARVARAFGCGKRPSPQNTVSACPVLRRCVA
ncbi:MAG: dTDP-4-dehydrorhamnose reductase [Acidobacteria bacterium]|nr:dTDP-4-dehydrorhamnose reductase [Acidobacteriota bacterium]